MSNILQVIKESWSEDSKIDSLQIRNEIIRTPILHSKYLNYLIEIKCAYREVEVDVIKMHRLKSRYYKGEMGREELLELNWDQYQGIKPIKSELETLITTDSDMVELSTKLNYYKICLDTLESIIKAIASRSYDVRALLEAEKFYSGS